MFKRSLWCISVPLCASVMIAFTLLLWPGMKCSKLHGYRWVRVWVSVWKDCHTVFPFFKLNFINIRGGGGSTYQSYFNLKKNKKQKAQPSRTIIFLIFVWWYFHWRRTNTKVFCFFPQEGHEQVVSPEKAEILQCVQQNTRDFLSVGRQQTKQTNLEGHLCDTSWTR